MERYEFELLSFIERYGQGDYSVRTLSDSLCISGTEIVSCIKKLHANGWIKVDGNFLGMTDAGVEALEPYRVKRAIILAAGFGSRMMPATKERPKPMVEVNGTRIIDTLLDALISVGIEDIIVVGGYRGEKLRDLLEKYPQLIFVDNPLYDKENNISSIMQVIEKIQGGCYICEADLFINNPDVIKKYQYASNILGSYSMETDDWCFDMVDGFITNYKKGGKYCYNYYGISHWTPEDCEKLRSDYVEYYEKPDGNQLFWEFIPLIEERDKYRVEVRPCKKQDIMEIDNYYELVQLDSKYIFDPTIDI